MGRLPEHIAIIMDGNGRWAEMRGVSRIEGHRRGAERTGEIIEACCEIGIKNLTLYTFSMENWKRPEDEVAMLMSLLRHYLEKETENMIKKGISLRFIGNIALLPDDLIAQIRETEKMTLNGLRMRLILALSYGGRDEIIRSIKKIMLSGIKPDELNEKIFSQYLDTEGIPDPDMIIRTSGEKRLSNFLIYQSAYSELYFTDTLWPDFTKEEFFEVIRDYQKRQRRFGGLN